LELLNHCRFTFHVIYNDSFKRNRIGANGENLFQFIKSFEDKTLDPRLIHPKSEGETIEYNVRGWLSVISPNVKFRYEIEKNSDTSYSMFNEHRATNVGFGLSYSLSVIASLLIGTIIPNSLVIIENPEAHLHPKGQTEISKLIALCAQVGTQVIIETHSDHLFDGIRIAAKESKDFAKYVQIHWFELNEKQNTEVASPILNDDGRLDKWPPGLFDQFELNASKLL
jgi:predicted ATPase